jgi:S1-C subfamily serine protease
VNLDGTVLGVINSGGGKNIAFAISAPLARKVVPALIENGRYRHPTLGLRLVPVTDAVAAATDLDRTRGLLVASVAEGAPAAAGGRAGSRLLLAVVVLRRLDPARVLL